MGEIAAATIFHQMAAGCKEPVFQAAFRNIGQATRAATWAICMSLMERDYPKLDGVGSRSVITKQIRAGYLFLSAVLFEPPMEFWDLPADFIDNQREGEKLRPRGRLRTSRPTTPRRRTGATPILNLKGVLDKLLDSLPGHSGGRTSPAKRCQRRRDGRHHPRLLIR
jgi:hypothetical protein